jgi:GNAT superfamily N-acetyltransferase
MTIQPWTADQTTQRADELGRLLCNAVNSGGSLGFVAPLERERAWAHWQDVARRQAAGDVQLLVFELDGHAIGAVQLHDAPHQALQDSATHRVEVAQLMVRSVEHQKGYGRRLMLAAEALARERGRTTLVLHTRSGDRAERLFQSLGWVKGGEVPAHSRGADGGLHATSVYYLLLGEPRAAG